MNATVFFEYAQCVYVIFFLIDGKSWTPLRVPSKKDDTAVASRRLSALLLAKFAPSQRKDSPMPKSRRQTLSAFPSARPLNTPIRRSIGAYVFFLFFFRSVNGITLSTSFSSANRESGILPTLQLDSPAVIPAVSEDDESLEEDSENKPSSPVTDENLAPVDDSENEPEMPLEPQAPNGEPSSVADFYLLVEMEKSRLESAKSAWEEVMRDESAAIPEVGK